MNHFDKWSLAGIYSYLAYLEKEVIEQLIGLLDKEDSEIKAILDADNDDVDYDDFKLLEPGLREIKDHEKGSASCIGII